MSPCSPPSVAAIFSTATDPDGPLATSLAAAARHAGTPVPTLPHDVVFVGHSAGAEAVAFVADRIRTQYPQTWNTLRGMVLLDPVRSFIGDNIDNALTGIDSTPLPVLAISAAPALYNSFGLGTLVVQTRLHRPFVGVRSPAGAHTDAEGSSSDLLGGLLCGFPDPKNAAALQTLALGWINDFRTSTATPEYYPTAVVQSCSDIACVSKGCRSIRLDRHLPQSRESHCGSGHSVPPEQPTKSRGARRRR